MPRANQLTDYEKGLIDGLSVQGLSRRQIAKEVNRSPCVVNNYLKLGENYGTKKSPGRPKKLTDRDCRQILRLSSAGNSSCNEILRQTNLPVCQRTILNVIHESDFMKWEKKDKKPNLSLEHKLARQEFAKTHMTWDNKWLSVIFSGEKKFNSDGPDGSNFYWHDLRKEKEIFAKRNFGGGSLMVWGAFCYNGVLPLVKISTRMNSADYQEVLSEGLLPFAGNLAGENYIFQQDNASIHASSSTLAYLKEHGINVMKWPARSPDLNPIENIWGILARKVYKNQRQFHSIDTLWTVIQEEWYSLDPEMIQKLVETMKERIFEVISLNGAQTHY